MRFGLTPGLADEGFAQISTQLFQQASSVSGAVALSRPFKGLRRPDMSAGARQSGTGLMDKSVPIPRVA